MIGFFTTHENPAIIGWAYCRQSGTSGAYSVIADTYLADDDKDTFAHHPYTFIFNIEVTPPLLEESLSGVDALPHGTDSSIPSIGPYVSLLTYSVNNLIYVGDYVYLCTSITETPNPNFNDQTSWPTDLTIENNTIIDAEGREWKLMGYYNDAINPKTLDRIHTFEIFDKL